MNSRVVIKTCVLIGENGPQNDAAVFEISFQVQIG